MGKETKETKAPKKEDNVQVLIRLPKKIEELRSKSSNRHKKR